MRDVDVFGLVGFNPMISTYLARLIFDLELGVR